MKLFLISQEKNTGYDTFDSAVVAAPDADTARQMDPGSGEPIVTDDPYSWRGWVSSPADVQVECIGTAARGTKQGVIIASFNAG